MTASGFHIINREAGAAPLIAEHEGSLLEPQVFTQSANGRP
jgi:hypothetical protein